MMFERRTSSVAYSSDSRDEQHGVSDDRSIRASNATLTYCLTEFPGNRFCAMFCKNHGPASPLLRGCRDPKLAVEGADIR